MREFSDASKKSKKGKKCGAFIISAIFIALTFSGIAHAVTHNTVRYNRRIETLPGFRFENFVYDWDKVVLSVVNTTSDNTMFGATMVFLDRRGRPLARASLLPKTIAGLESERYIAFFIEGFGEAAQRARSVRWDFVTVRRDLIAR